MLGSDVLYGVMGVGGSDDMRVSKIGIPSGSERRVIQNANGKDSYSNIRSDLSTKDVVEDRRGSTIDSGTVNCCRALSYILTWTLL